MIWWEWIIAIWVVAAVVFLWLLYREFRRPMTDQELRSEEIEREEFQAELDAHQADLQEWLQERRID